MGKEIMYGLFIKSIDSQFTTEEHTFLWVAEGDLEAETESETRAAEDQALQTKCCATKICKTEQVTNADYVKKCDEAIDQDGGKTP
jgi:hypothetical protein